ncbi:MAG: Ig-like domain-containing protein, partial [Krumholzibacteria bacterium]|nr:Ig-like domain-containing protein [Candidatus Krumholzibacteria bacterium]
MSAALLAACAVVEAPPGGPLDTVPPRLVASTPDSGATGLGEVRTLRFLFSEKMDRQPATGWLYFFPDQRIRRTKWHGAVEAEVELEQPLPPDTTVVVELAARLRDAHQVRARESRRFPVATGDTIPGGAIAGVLVMGDSAVTRGVVELFALPPDSLELADMPLLRRTSTDGNGAYVFSWLPVPGGPWRLRAFVDADGDLRAGDQEARRVLPDTIATSAEAPLATAGVLTLYAPDTPGRLLVRPFTLFGAAEPVVFFTQQVTEADTGWTPQPVGRGRGNFVVLAGRTGGAVDQVRPGANRVGVFVDVDGDTAYGPVPGDAVRALAGEFAWTLSDSAGDTTGWYLEPLVLLEAPDVEAGLDAWYTLPDSLPRLVPWPAPPPRPRPGGVRAGVRRAPRRPP